MPNTVFQAITTNSTNIATNTSNIATNTSEIAILDTRANNLQAAINSLPSYNSMVLSGIGATLSTAYSQILISATIVTQSTNPALLNFNTTTGIITINGYGTFILLANGSINPIGSGTRTLNFQIRNAVGGAVVSTASITVGANEGAFSIANAFTIDATTFPTLPLTINTYASDNSGTSTYTNPSYTLSLNTNGGGGGIITSDQVQNASTAVGATVTEALTSNTADIASILSLLMKNYTASEDIPAGLLLAGGSSPGTVKIATSAITDSPLGTSNYTSTILAGEQVPCLFYGIVSISTLNSITAGTLISTTALGQAKLANMGERIYGYAIEDSAGGMVKIILNVGLIR